MFVSNLTNSPLGIDGIQILKPREENRYVEDTEDLVDRVKRLEAVKLVAVKREEGLTKLAVTPVVTKATAKNKVTAKTVVVADPVVEVVDASAATTDTK